MALTLAPPDTSLIGERLSGKTLNIGDQWRVRAVWLLGLQPQPTALAAILPASRAINVLALANVSPQGINVTYNAFVSTKYVATSWPVQLQIPGVNAEGPPHPCTHCHQLFPSAHAAEKHSEQCRDVLCRNCHRSFLGLFAYQMHRPLNACGTGLPHSIADSSGGTADPPSSDAERSPSPPPARAPSPRATAPSARLAVEEDDDLAARFARLSDRDDAPAAAQLKPFYVRDGLTLAQYTDLRAVSNDRAAMRSKPTSLPAHGHPFAGALNDWIHYHAYGLLADIYALFPSRPLITDVGVNVRRSSEALRQLRREGVNVDVHGLAPDAIHGDTDRISAYRREGGHIDTDADLADLVAAGRGDSALATRMRTCPLRWCNCRLHNCSHLPEGRKRVYLCIFSAWYLDDAEIVRALLQRDDVFAVVHDYAGPQGSILYGEQKYSVEYKGAEPVVTATTTGNGAPYRHRIPAWMTQGGFATGVAAQPFVHVTTVHAYGPHARLVHFTLHDTPPVPNVHAALRAVDPSTFAQLMRVDHPVIVNAQASSVVVPNAWALANGLCIASGDHEGVPIAAEVLAAVTTHVLTSPKSGPQGPATLRGAQHKAKMAYENLHWPVGYLAASVNATADAAVCDASYLNAQTALHLRASRAARVAADRAMANAFETGQSWFHLAFEATAGLIERVAGHFPPAKVGVATDVAKGFWTGASGKLVDWLPWLGGILTPSAATLPPVALQAPALSPLGVIAALVLAAYFGPTGFLFGLILDAYACLPGRPNFFVAYGNGVIEESFKLGVAACTGLHPLAVASAFGFFEGLGQRSAGAFVLTHVMAHSLFTLTGVACGWLFGSCVGFACAAALHESYNALVALNLAIVAPDRFAHFAAGRHMTGVVHWLASKFTLPVRPMSFFLGLAALGDASRRRLNLDALPALVAERAAWVERATGVNPAGLALAPGWYGRPEVLPLRPTFHRELAYIGDRVLSLTELALSCDAPAGAVSWDERCKQFSHAGSTARLCAVASLLGIPAPYTFSEHVRNPPHHSSRDVAEFLELLVGLAVLRGGPCRLLDALHVTVRLHGPEYHHLAYSPAYVPEDVLVTAHGPPPALPMLFRADAQGIPVDAGSGWVGVGPVQICKGYRVSYSYLIAEPYHRARVVHYDDGEVRYFALCPREGHPLYRGQDAIGLLGAGASKGDGPAKPPPPGLPTVTTYCPGALGWREADPRYALVYADRSVTPCEPSVAAVACFALRGRPPHVSRHCSHNSANSFMQRYALGERVTAAHFDSPTFAHHMWIIDRMLDRGLLAYRPLVPTDPETWLARFPPARREALITAYAANGYAPRGFTSSAFVKTELCAKFSWATPTVAARGIQNPHPATTRHYGPFYHALGKSLRELWAGPIHYTSGHSATDLGELMTDNLDYVWFRGCVADTDGERFDGRTTLAGHAVEARIATTLGMPARVSLPNYDPAGKIYLDSRRVCVRVRVRRDSGRPDTTTGNSSQGGVLHYDLACELGHEHSFRAMVVGDDGNGYYPASPPAGDIRTAASTCFARLGHLVKTEVVSGRNPLAVKYNSGRAFLTSTGRRLWSVLPGRAVAKMGWWLQCNSQIDFRTWLASTSAAWMHDTAHVPVVRALAARMVEWSRALGGTPGAITERRPRAASPAACDEAGLLEFATHYGVTLHDIAVCEAEIATWPLGHVSDNWLLHHLADTDCPVGVNAPADVDSEMLAPLRAPAPSAAPWGAPGPTPAFALEAADFPRQRRELRRLIAHHRPQAYMAALPDLSPLATLLFAAVLCCSLLCGAQVAEPRAPACMSKQPAKPKNGTVVDIVIPPAAGAKPASASSKSRASGALVELRPGNSRGRAAAPRVSTLVQAPRPRVSDASAPRGKDRPSSSARAHPRLLASHVPTLASAMQGLPGPVQMLVAQLCLPELFGTFRANPGCATKETAVSTTWQRAKLAIASSAATTAGGADQLPITDSVAFVFRDPLRGVVLYDPNAPLTQWIQTLIFLAGSGVSFTANAGKWLEFASAVWSGSYSGTSYAVTDGADNAALWVDRPASLTARGTGGAPAQTTLTITGTFVNGTNYTVLIRTENAGSVYDDYETATASATAIVVTLPLGHCSGYTSVQWCGVTGAVDAAVVIGGAYFTGKCSVFQHLPMANFSSLAPAMNSGSINSATVMWTNTASALNKQGQVVQMQVSGGVPWPSMLGMASIATNGGNNNLFITMSDEPGSMPRPAENGAFSFLRPTSTARSFTRRAATPGTSTESSTTPTVPDDDYLMLYVNTGATATNQAGYWSFVHGLEYETEDLTRERLVPPTKALTFLAAMDESSRIPQHHTNAFHIMDIIPGIVGALVKPPSGGTGGFVGGILNAATEVLSRVHP